MARGISNTDAKGLSKLEGVRRALAALGYDATPAGIQAYLKKEYGIAMETGLISNYKSSIKSSGKSAVMRKPAGRPAAKSKAGAISVDDVRAVKELADRIGAEELKQLAEMLAR